MRHNHLIRNVGKVNLIDETGKQLGIFDLYRAKEIALERSLDLVEVNPSMTPPICKIMDYGKYKFEQNKNRKPPQKEALKEVELSPGIAEHDLQIKARKVQEFLNDGCKVVVRVRFKGRQAKFTELGQEQLTNVLNLLDPKSYVASETSLNGKLLIVTLTSKV